MLKFWPVFTLVIKAVSGARGPAIKVAKSGRRYDYSFWGKEDSGKRKGRKKKMLSTTVDDERGRELLVEPYDCLP